MVNVKQTQDLFHQMKDDLQGAIVALKKAGDTPATSLQTGHPLDIMRAMLENINKRLKAIEDAPPSLAID